MTTIFAATTGKDRCGKKAAAGNNDTVNISANKFCDNIALVHKLTEPFHSIWFNRCSNQAMLMPTNNSSAVVGACQLSCKQSEVSMQSIVNFKYSKSSRFCKYRSVGCCCVVGAYVGSGEVELTSTLLVHVSFPAASAGWSLRSVDACCTAQDVQSSTAQPECFACCRSEEIVPGHILHVGIYAALTAVLIKH